MSIWAGIKFALNSTLGTPNFKPLDKIFYNGKTVIPSDNDLFIVSPNLVKLGYKEKHDYDKKIIARTKGAAKIVSDMEGSFDNGRAYLYININGERAYSLSSLRASEGRRTLSITISFDENDVITFSAAESNTPSSHTRTAKIYNVKICGDVIDSSIFQIETI